MPPINEVRDVFETGELKAEIESQNKVAQTPEESKIGVRPYLSSRKERLAEQLSHTARALEDSSAQLSDHRSSGLIRMTAEKIDQLGSYLGNHAVDEIFDDLQDFARTRPLTVMGSAFIVGLAAARFFKASERTTIEE
jgi:hypothetical protein